MRAPDIESQVPLIPGVYRGSLLLTAVMVMAGLLFTLVSLLLFLTLVKDGSSDVRVVALVAGTGFCVLFFGVATVGWALQALVVKETGLHSRFPMPGSARVSFSQVKAIVVFPVVHSAAGNMPLVLLLDESGRNRFRMSTPPYPAKVLDGFVAYAQRQSGAPALACQDEARDSQFIHRVQLPHLVPGT